MMTADRGAKWYSEAVVLACLSALVPVTAFMAQAGYAHYFGIPLDCTPLEGIVMVSRVFESVIAVVVLVVLQAGMFLLSTVASKAFPRRPLQRLEAWSERSSPWQRAAFAVPIGSVGISIMLAGTSAEERWKILELCLMILGFYVTSVAIVTIAARTGAPAKSIDQTSDPSALEVERWTNRAKKFHLDNRWKLGALVGVPLFLYFVYDSHARKAERQQSFYVYETGENDPPVVILIFMRENALGFTYDEQPTDGYRRLRRMRIVKLTDRPKFTLERRELGPLRPAPKAIERLPESAAARAVQSSKSLGPRSCDCAPQDGIFSFDDVLTRSSEFCSAAPAGSMSPRSWLE